MENRFLNISSLPAQAEHAPFMICLTGWSKKEFFLSIQQRQMSYMIAREMNLIPIDISSIIFLKRSWSENQIMQSYHGGKQDLISVVLSKI